MEKKKTQRIIGILVVIALVVIMLPLLFGKNDAPMQQAATVKAPPFPDQQVNTDAAASTENPSLASTDSQQQASAPAQQDEVTSPFSPAPDADQVSDNSVSAAATPQPDASVIAPAAPSDSSPTASVAEKPTSQQPRDTTSLLQAEPKLQTSSAGNQGLATTSSAAASEEEGEGVSPASNSDAPVVKPAIAEEPAVRVIPKKAATALLAHHPRNMARATEKFGSPAWAVQLGSFKVKENAQRLTDKLRAAGFKAFTRELRSAKGAESTRVYVGPEFKQASAVKLSGQVQQKINMQGIVVPYKPLEL